MADTLEFMFSNVAYKAIVYRTGGWICYTLYNSAEDVIFQGIPGLPELKVVVNM